MARMAFYLNLIRLCLCLISTVPRLATPINSTSDIHVTVAPPTIYEGFTRDLLLNCSFLLSNHSDFHNVISIIVYKTPSTGDSVYREIASITNMDPEIVVVKDDLGAQATGRLSPNGLSFIAFTWKYPSREVLGTFKCEAFGTDNAGHPRTSCDVTQIRERRLGTGDIIAKIQTLEQTQDSLRHRIDDSRSAMVQSSETYNGHTYLLSYPFWRNVRFADGMCRLYGGYLVEVDDQDELNFLVGFAKRNNVSGKTVILGANDEAELGKWRFFKSGGLMTSFDWVDQVHGGNGPTSNCMSLRYDGTDDVYCTYEDWSIFLCEVPEL